MPIYEYACRKCGEEFETLVRGGETPSCVHCASAEIDRKLSVFASQSKTPPSSACGACGHPSGPGACAFGKA